MSEQPNILDIVDAMKLLPDGKILFENVSMSLAAGESLSLLGKSGSGKSTLLSVLGFLDKFDSGKHLYRGSVVAKLSHRQLDHQRGNEIGFVFQRFSLISHLSVVENVMVPLRHGGRGGLQSMRSAAMQTLERVQMHRMAMKKPRQLSGGEQQRVAIARALVMRPRLILADEPTGSLDEEIGSAVMELLLELGTAEGSGIVVVTHDINIAAKTHRIAHMKDDTLTEGFAPQPLPNGRGNR
ncbi:hypothetical protein DQ354_19135 [Arthrobacter sp. AQ5-06]|nr:hypothetical protein DQ354_19135 [Arthrobacter sp. AQ5-06]